MRFRDLIPAFKSDDLLGWLGSTVNAAGHASVMRAVFPGGDIAGGHPTTMAQLAHSSGSWTCPVSTDGLKVLDLLGIFNQIDLTVTVN